MRRSPCWPTGVSACAHTHPCPCSRPPRPTASWKAATSTSASSSPYIPLLIGGDGEKVTLKLVAQYADACNVGDDPATVRQKLAVLKQHCETVGREYESIHRTSTTFCLMADSDEQAMALLPAERKARIGNKVTTALIGSPETI